MNAIVNLSGDGWYYNEHVTLRVPVLPPRGRSIIDIHIEHGAENEEQNASARSQVREVWRTVNRAGQDTETDSIPETTRGLNEYIEKAYGEFVDAQQRLEDIVRQEERKAERDYRKAEEKLISNLKTSLEKALQSHEHAISQSIRQYEVTLKNAAQEFIHSKTEAEANYHESLKQQTREMHRLLDNARITRNNRIDACHRRTLQR